MAPPIAVLDVDGTLVDTNYHHAIAWYRAFREHGLTLPVWRIHRHIGMGGDQLVAAVAGKRVEDRQGDSIRAAETALYADLIGEVQPFADARRLLELLDGRGHRLVLASSGKPDEVDHYLDLLDARDLVEAWTTSADVERTKPDPDLVVTAVDKVGGGEAVMVGDSTWDCEAAGRAERSGICVVGAVMAAVQRAVNRMLHLSATSIRGNPPKGSCLWGKRVNCAISKSLD
jgi:HAD superfamily hydrolase (TIGR01549 family)